MNGSMLTSADKRARLAVSLILIIVLGGAASVIAAVGVANGYPEMWLGIVWSGILLGVFGIMAAVRWIPSSPADGECASAPCYCEAYSEGIVKQPINVWSTLAWILSGMAILYIVCDERARGISGGPMTGTTMYALLYVVIVIFMGPGSAYFHGSMKNWGGYLDSLSIHLWILFSFLFTLFTLFTMAAGATMLDQGWQIAFLITFLLVGIGVALTDWRSTGFRENFSIIGGAIWGVFELVVLIVLASTNAPVQRAEWWWFVAALVALGLAILIWKLSDTGGPWCAPRSWLQGHAIWHLLTGAVTFFVFLFFRSV